MQFIQNLIEQIKDKSSVVCMGLDPRLEEEGQIPKFLVEDLGYTNDVIVEFNKELIDNVYDLIPVIKPQMAFYEKYEALKALKQTIKYAHKRDLLVILDSKRNDIGSTSEAYAEVNYEVFNADACTVNAYFGIDGVQPFLEYKEKGLFILVKTSNPSSGEFQNLFSIKRDDVPASQMELEVDDKIMLERNYIQMAKLINDWGKELKTHENYHGLGAVVGATYPEEMKHLRKLMRSSFFLIPGYGAQGATAKDIAAGFDSDGLGGIVNSSRGIMFAYSKINMSPEKFGEAARTEIINMNEAINSSIKK